MQPPCTDSASLELVKPLTGQTTNRHGTLEAVPCHQSSSIMTDTTQSKRLENAVAPSGGQNGSVAEELSNLRTRCPLPVLMSRMGYAKFATRTCSSPFRADKKPSWGIFQRNDRWFWKDHGTGDSGDEIGFIVRAKKLPTAHSFQKAVDVWKHVADRKSKADEVEVLKIQDQTPREKPDRSGFGPGSDAQLEKLCRLRRINPLGVVLAQMHGVLVFGTLAGHEVFGVTDSSGHALEVRRLDGEVFPSWGTLPERKSHAVKGSRKGWPVGLAEVGTKGTILLVEGLPDLLAAFEVVAQEGAMDKVCPVAMLSGSASIGTDALPAFKGKHVRIVPHNDAAGRKGVARWKEQLLAAGAARVDFVFLCADEEVDNTPIKDLNDYLPIYRNDLASNPTEGRLL